MSELTKICIAIGSTLFFGSGLYVILRYIIINYFWNIDRKFEELYKSRNILDISNAEIKKDVENINQRLSDHILHNKIRKNEITQQNKEE